MLLYGSKLAQKINEEVRDGARRLKARVGLGIILVGDDEASHIYVKKKIEAARKAGIDARLFHLPRSTEERELVLLVRKLNADKKIDGFIVQLPLPRHINSERVLETVTPSKDVDGLHPINMGRVLMNLGDGLAPATPLGIMALLDHYKVKLAGVNAVVIGRSNILGKPVALMLLHKDATVTLCHSKTRDLSEHTKKADIVIAAAGMPGLIKPGMVKKGAWIIDGGTRRVNGKVVGDVEPSVQKKANVSPVPGGVGPLTVAMLLKNTLKAAKLRQNAQK